MLISEVIGSDISIRKTVWSKRGDRVTRRVVDQNCESDITPKTHLEIKNKRENENGYMHV